MARILLVDDEGDLLETVGVLLKHEGHELIRTCDGAEALEYIRGLEPIDLLVTDIRMAPVNGLQLMEIAHRERPHLHIIVVSSYLDDETIQKAVDMGCSAYIKKPFMLRDILDPIREVLANMTKGGEAPETE